MKNFSPSWAAPSQVRIDSGSSPLACWQVIHPIVEILGELLGVEIAVIDLDYLCVAGTGPYKEGLGFRVPKDTALGYGLRSRKESMLLHPGSDDTCRSCPIKSDCRDQANYTGPIYLDGRMIGAMQIVAFDQHQRSILVEKAEYSFFLVCRLIEQLYRTGALRPFAESEDNLVAERSTFTRVEQLENIVGESPAMITLKEHILKAAACDAVVIIQGESGTGKELIAQAIHKCSARKMRPFIAINCGAIPEALLESELFGYDGGAFSGASPQGRKGLLEMARGGTVFFDEISELPYPLQVKLLRVLQERSFRRLGGQCLIHFDSRVIAASNQNLGDLVRTGKFRTDLYYRLNVIPINAPALRERREDIGLLVNHFIKDFLTEVPGKITGVTRQLMRRFESYAWPGNVRELRNFIEYGVHFCPPGPLTLEHMEHRFEALPPVSIGPESDSSQAMGEREASVLRLYNARKSVDLDQVMKALTTHGSTLKGKKSAARQLGISLSTLYRILRAQT